jgi:UDP:flavonoid glycosyltransferase YjiC (YdhE family)
MRVLFASLGSVGHAYPMAPLAIAALEAGHEVHFAVGADVHPELAAHGLRPFRPADAFYELYAEDLVPDLERLHPDLVVHGWGVPGAGAAAARAGIPALWHGVGRLFPDGIGFDRPSNGRPHVDICPPSLQDPSFVAAEARIPLRPMAFPPAGRPSTWDGRGARPRVYLTLGTAFGTREVLLAAIAGLAAIGAEVVVATGRVIPAELGQLPAGVTALPWVDQAGLLPRADVVVHHGGSGTTLGALAAGVPQLVLPQGADQFANGEALVAAGAGLALRPEELSAEAVAASTRHLLDGTAHRDAARALAVEIAALPGPDEVAADLPAYASF